MPSLQWPGVRVSSSSPLGTAQTADLPSIFGPGLATRRSAWSGRLKTSSRSLTFKPQKGSVPAACSGPRKSALTAAWGAAGAEAGSVGLAGASPWAGAAAGAWESWAVGWQAATSPAANAAISNRRMPASIVAASLRGPGSNGSSGEMSRPLAFYEFFAGGGMARLGLGRGWTCAFANDFDPVKADVYRANFG